jgi:hypothetical protein
MQIHVLIDLNDILDVFIYFFHVFNPSYRRRWSRFLNFSNTHSFNSYWDSKTLSEFLTQKLQFHLIYSLRLPVLLDFLIRGKQQIPLRCKTYTCNLNSVRCSRRFQNKRTIYISSSTSGITNDFNGLQE